MAESLVTLGGAVYLPPHRLLDDPRCGKQRVMPLNEGLCLGAGGASVALQAGRGRSRLQAGNGSHEARMRVMLGAERVYAVEIPADRNRDRRVDRHRALTHCVGSRPCAPTPQPCS